LKLTTLIISIGFLADVVTLGSFIALNFPIIFEALGRIPISLMLILVVTIVIAIILAKVLWSTRLPLDPKFKNLQIYYSNENDSPFIDRRPNLPYYIVNITTNHAYYVPDFIIPYVQKGNIAFSTRHNENELYSYFETQGIIYKNPKYATDEDLGLWFLLNRNLVLAENKVEPDLLEKLKRRAAETKLKNYQIIFLFPKYCWFFRFRKVEEKAWPPSRRILADYSTKEAFAAPSETMDLWRNRIISLDVCTPRPTEDISGWCKRKRKLTFNYRTFVVEELLQDH
jgi:hypothetical protein